MADLDVTFTQLSQLSRAYGAPAVTMAERVLQRSAAGQIVTGVVFAGIGVALGFCLYGLAKAFKRYNDDYSELGTGLTIGSVIGFLLSLIGFIGMGILAVGSLADVWAWTALTDPQLALAHQIFGSMGGR